MNAIRQAWERTTARYSNGDDRPLTSYSTAMAVYGGVVTGIAVLARRTGTPFPRLTAGDLSVMAVATYRLSRTLAKDPVTSPIRAPFTTYKEASGPAELAEEVEGHGAKHAVGELLSCPFCLAQWIATFYAGGLVFAPRATRFAGATMVAVAASDWLQFAHTRLQQSVE